MDMSRGVPVRVRVETWVNQEGQEEHHSFDEPGQLIQLGDTLYVRYVESSNEKVPVTIKIKGEDTIVLTRGASDSSTRSQLHFVAEKEIRTQYHTPYGVVPVTTSTPRIDINFQPDPVEGQVYVEYRLSANGQHLGDYRMRLLFNA